jgi:hypothetical protein
MHTTTTTTTTTNAPVATQTAHTPGPWEIDGDTIQGAPELNGEQPHAVEATCVAVVLSRERGSYRHYPKERATANARLIAASPSLYAFVKARADAGDTEAKQTLDASQITD